MQVRVQMDEEPQVQVQVVEQEQEQVQVQVHLVPMARLLQSWLKVTKLISKVGSCIAILLRTNPLSLPHSTSPLAISKVFELVTKLLTQRCHNLKVFPRCRSWLLVRILQERWWRVAERRLPRNTQGSFSPGPCRVGRDLFHIFIYFSETAIRVSCVRGMV